jgi:hypothetical protein
MPKLDDAIRATLAAEDRELLAQFEKEPNVFDEAIQALTGRMLFVNVLVAAITFAATAAGFYFGWKLLTADSVREAVNWGAGLGVSLAFVSLLKIWFWLEMQSNRVIREVKRLELQVAALAKTAV